MGTCGGSLYSKYTKADLTAEVRWHTYGFSILVCDRSVWSRLLGCLKYLKAKLQFMFNENPA